ncbi:MAG TPA: 4-hydroxy-tetrahydrodipicolinate synthase [Desulfobacteraceae bacterium]|nr:4-hydroxy-tetrahydrodipicolinate synthase [Deltaproteobacteria bacterium]MBW2356103.1 4-hydroxy-tetrahydrodipicolinate synthase [Deltaproteobacteria bacterium]RLB98368.1 MAG: 4-hydroxy-tetrahydrodipicolinate synthase [Deltaproteobacteria bacterium]HDI59904.1 4-hydroxy-tetrahydrodipicolinate synthase [Desulfobacteraceae bacterium]
MQPGCYTALITPFAGGAVDDAGLRQIVSFQIENGITGLLAVGTTGESPTLTWEEHNRVIAMVAGMTRGRCLCIAGTGSNNTAETLEGTRYAVAAGADAVLLVDPYYNGPSSLEIRREYVAPVAETFPDIHVIPYVIPGRTGAQLLPEDLALLHRRYPNVHTVKEATGDPANMRRTRACCGPDLVILSGDDGMTFEMMNDPAIAAAGVISVISNIAPRAVGDMVAHLAAGEYEEAASLRHALDPLFNLVTVKTTEQTPFGEVVCRARNPLAVKTLMTVLGMPSGGCRRPIGRMTAKGLETVLSAARQVQERTPEIFAPLADFFNVDVTARLQDPVNWRGLAYDAY